MYDLAGADPDLRFSPYCWRTRFALAHKGLPVETMPWRFTDRDAIAFSGQAKVPVIQDGGKVVSDSWAIAEYLEEQLPASDAVRRRDRAGARRVHQHLGRRGAGRRDRAVHRARPAGYHRPQGRRVFPFEPGGAFRLDVWKQCRQAARTVWRRFGSC